MMHMQESHGRHLWRAQAQGVQRLRMGHGISSLAVRSCRVWQADGGVYTGQVQLHCRP